MITGFDHVNIRTMDVAGTLAFFRDVLEMGTSPFPGRKDMEKAGWVLDPNGNALIHVNYGEEVYPTDQTTPWTPATGGGAVHHVALNCSGFEQMRDRLESRGLDYVENEVPQINLRQLFVQDPNGIMMELNFR